MKSKKKEIELDEIQWRAATPWEKNQIKKKMKLEQINICLTINFEENDTRFSGKPRKQKNV